MRVNKPSLITFKMKEKKFYAVLWKKKLIYIVMTMKVTKNTNQKLLANNKKFTIMEEIYYRKIK